MTKPLESQSIPLQLRVDAANAALAYMNACIHQSETAAKLRTAPNDATLVSVAGLAYDVKRICHDEMLNCARACAMHYKA